MLYEKIVAVDDNPKSLEAIKLALHNQYEIVLFSSGEEALEYLRKPNRVSVVLLDVYMKGINGITTLKEIKSIDKDVLVIIMTAFGDKDIVLQALQGHADDFIEKPFDINDLRERISRHLKAKAPFSVGKDENIQRMRNYIQKNVSHITLRDVAGEICLSEKYVSRLFKEKNNETFRNYKVQIRMAKARHLLKVSTYTIEQISLLLGYQNSESFMRIFKRLNGMTPSQYRKKQKKGA